MTENAQPNPLARFAHGLYGIGAFIIKGIAKSLGIMAMQMFIFLAISTPIAIVIGIGALLTGTGLHVVALALPVGMLLVVVLALSGIDDMGGPPATSSRTTGGRSRGRRRPKGEDPEEVLGEIADRGIEAMLEMNDRRVRSIPQLRSVADALESAGESVAYNGPYTGPGPSTSDMYDRAGFPSMSRMPMDNREPRENRFSLRRASRSPGTSSYRSFDLTEYKADETDNAVFYISSNRSAGTPDDSLIVEETRTTDEDEQT